MSGASVIEWPLRTMTLASHEPACSSMRVTWGARAAGPHLRSRDNASERTS